MGRFQELATVRLRSRHTGPDSYGRGVCTLPAGTIGTVVAWLGHQDAYEVEFEVRPPRFSGSEILDYGETCVATLGGDQITSA